MAPLISLQYAISIPSATEELELFFLDEQATLSFSVTYSRSCFGASISTRVDVYERQDGKSVCCAFMCKVIAQIGFSHEILLIEIAHSK